MVVYIVTLTVLIMVAIPAQAQLPPQPKQEGSDDFLGGWSPDSSQIVFTSSRSGNNDIYVAGIEDGSLKQLTNTPEIDNNPAWSADGEHILYVSYDGTNSDIFVMSVSDGAAVNVTHNPGRDYGAVWSPDGKQIAFLSDQSSGQDGLYVMNADGSNVHNVSHGFVPSTGIKWSPDGKYLAFELYEIECRIPRLMVVDLDGGEPKNLLDGYWFWTAPDTCYFDWQWSADGSSVAFNPPHDANVYAVDIASGRVRSLFYTGGYLADFDWRPASNHLYYTLLNNNVSIPPSFYGLYAADLSTGEVTQLNAITIGYSPDEQYVVKFTGNFLPDCCLTLTTAKANGSGIQANIKDIYNTLSNPIWSPDSRWVAAAVCMDGDLDIFVLNAETGVVRRLTEHDRFARRDAQVSTVCAAFG